jgi:hypothetical protein
MRQAFIFFLFIVVALGASSCYYTRPACAPVVVTREVPSSLPLYPAWSPYCHYGYGNCGPQHLPYVLKKKDLNVTLPPYPDCHPCP